MLPLLIPVSANATDERQTEVKITLSGASAFDLGRDGTFDFFVDNLVTGLSPLRPNEQRAVIEGELPPKPAGTALASALFKGFIFGSSGIRPFIEMHGFFGNGVVELADANSVSNLLASFDGYAGQDVEFDLTPFIQSALDAGQGYVGFTFRDTVPGSFSQFFPGSTEIVLTFLPVDGDGDGVLDADDFCPGTVLPDEPTVGLKGARLAAQDDGTFHSAKDRFDGVFTLADTAGCQGSQIITEMGLGYGHIKFGISKGELQKWIAGLTAD